MDRRHRFGHRAPDHGRTHERNRALGGAGRCRIAYASEEVDFDLTLITPDGRSSRTMLATARNEFDPAWSPVGDQFAFVTDRSGSLEIWTRSRDGVWERPIVTAADFGTSRTETLASLAFSPDGRTLAYQRGAEGTWDVWLSPVTGGTPVRLTATPGSTTRPWRDAPTWSPDGEWIAYVNNDTRQAGADQDARGHHRKRGVVARAVGLLAAGVVAGWQVDRIADRRGARFACHLTAASRNC